MKYSVTNMASPKTHNAVPNQYLIHTPEGTYFQSYASIIVHKANDGTITLGKDWDYSRTTGKYRSIFLRENTAETRKKLNAGIYKYSEEL